MLRNSAYRQNVYSLPKQTTSYSRADRNDDVSKTKSRRGAYLRTIRKTLTGPLQKLRIRMLAGKRRRSRARFIAVTGSSGKSTTVHVLGAILAGHANVRAQMMRNTVPTLIRTIS